MMQLLPKVKGSQALKPVTYRDFSGGWNVLDDDLNLPRKFSTRMYNCYHAVDNSVAVRYGTSLFAYPGQATSHPSSLVGMAYYHTVIICVMSNGEIVTVNAAGTMHVVWNKTIAAALSDNPDGWHATTFASFAQFNGELIIANGVDKPLIVRRTLTVEYLHDEGTGTNINTPIAKYVTVSGRYLIFAGDPINPNRVHISAKDTSGTFYGDPAPNDATFVDIGSVLANASSIRGIIGFRGKLVIAYPEGTILGVLGIYDAANVIHLPNFDDAVEQYGSISHRTLISFGDDMLMMDHVGVPSLKRTVFTGTIKPERISDVVDPEIAAALSPLSDNAQDENTWGIYNQREGQFMFFIPNNSDQTLVTETKVYTYIYRPTLNISGWARFDGWNFTCGVRSAEDNIFFGDKQGKLWRHGNILAPIYQDFLDDFDVNLGQGTPISFDWELPWSDFGKRQNTKTSRYFSCDTRGTAEFTVEMYIDRFVKGENNSRIPALSMTMVGGDVMGFGAGEQSYGGGRLSSDERFYAWPAKFKIAKMRFKGDADAPLRFVSLMFYTIEGGMSR